MKKDLLNVCVTFIAILFMVAEGSSAYAEREFWFERADFYNQKSTSGEVVFRKLLQDQNMVAIKERQEAELMAQEKIEAPKKRQPQAQTDAQPLIKGSQQETQRIAAEKQALVGVQAQADIQAQQALADAQAKAQAQADANARATALAEAEAKARALADEQARARAQAQADAQAQASSNASSRKSSAS